MKLFRVRHFEPYEFACKCCNKGEPAVKLVFALEMLRRAWGDPILVNSGFRCPKRNAKVGGMPGSRHLIGCAADIRPVHGFLFNDFKTLTRKLYGGLTGWEFIEYANFIHLAVPRECADVRWRGEDFKITVANAQ